MGKKIIVKNKYFIFSHNLSFNLQKSKMFILFVFEKTFVYNYLYRFFYSLFEIICTNHA